MLCSGDMKTRNRCININGGLRYIAGKRLLGGKLGMRKMDLAKKLPHVTIGGIKIYDEEGKERGKFAPIIEIPKNKNHKKKGLVNHWHCRRIIVV